jgi:L-2-hydroxyglutarate oxidase LhgO
MSLLRDCCAEHDIPYEERGKLVVARDALELTRLREIEWRAGANGAEGLRWFDGNETRELEPNVVGVAALYSPRTALVDFAAVARALTGDVTRRSGSVLLNAEVIICAGLHSNRLARLTGAAPNPEIVPFRGEYLRLVDRRRDLVTRLIYPVPDPALPFLGVHFTPRITGEVDIGPNAVVALSREGYRRTNVVVRDALDTARSRGFWRLVRRHWRSGISGMRGSLSRRAFLHEARTFVPALEPEDVERAPAGVRAQAIDPDGSLVDDFRIDRLRHIVAVRNAPSPAATSSLAIAEHIVSLAADED